MMAGTTRERIRQEAMRLFVAHGIDAVSVRDIADAVGMNASNLYAHFAGKGELVQQLFVEGFADYARHLRAAAGLDDMVRVICRLHDTDLIRFRFLLLNQHTNLPAVPRGEANPIDVVQAAVTAAMARGEIPPGDAALVTAMIVGIVIQVATFRLYGRIDRDLSDMADEIVGACGCIARFRQDGQGLCPGLPADPA